MRLNQVIHHVVRVASGESNTLQTVDLIQLPDQPGQSHIAAAVCPVVGVHILPQ
eukprot:CAMPEP_0184473508 /NCGR_PEP_ID=MMETSP0740-20130409/123963_1 /TAXON_ID=385413 /ORGANISM="Thalassiosira miniscula, Strain CCMP1093" /LENGTH=53 /DNA_ID=CAMNT_0026850461 /DNA_START=136 /DNA_END=297 /DNA_ORIENTATION=-